MYSVIEFIRLTDSRWSYYIHRLRHRARINGTMRIRAWRSAYTKQGWLWCWSKTTRLVGAKAILARQHHRKAPTRSGCSAQARCWHTEGDEARDSIGANGDGALCGTMCVDVALPEPLHLQEPAPRRVWCNRIVALREGGRRRGISGSSIRIMYIHICQLRAQRAAEGRRQVSRLQLEGDSRLIRAEDDLEFCNI